MDTPISTELPAFDAEDLEAERQRRGQRATRDRSRRRIRTPHPLQALVRVIKDEADGS